MSIWNKILLGFIFLASVAFAYMAARTLKTHEYWRNQAKAYEYAVGLREAYQEACAKGGKLILLPADSGEEWEEDNELRQVRTSGKVDLDKLRDREVTIEETPGRDQLRAELHKAVNDRGKVWRNCEPQQVDATTLRVNTDLPDPHGIAERSRVFAFEEAPLELVGDQLQGGRYLGEFTVIASDEANGSVDLAPTMKLAQEEVDYIAGSIANRAKWILYETMPVDSHTAFAGMDEEELKELLPADSLAEYAHDGEMLTTDEVESLGLKGKVLAVDDDGEVLYEYCDADFNPLDVAGVNQSGKPVDENGTEVAFERIVPKEVKEGKGKYARPLRDYQVLSKSIHRQGTDLVRLIDVAQIDRDLVQGAADDVLKHLSFRKQEKAELQAELAERTNERDAVQTHHQTLAAALAAYQKTRDELITKNRATAAAIARIQADAAKQIDERLRRMAQTAAGSGGN